MHFLIVLGLIGAFFFFPRFRKLILTMVLLVFIGFTVIYGPLFIAAYLSGGMKKGDVIFVITLFSIITLFAIIYFLAYRKNRSNLRGKETFIQRWTGFVRQRAGKDN